MRHVTAMLGVVAVVLMSAGVAARAKPNFAGEWKKVATDGQGDPGVDLIITQAAGKVTVEDRRAAQKVSRAVWAGNALVATTKTRGGEEKRTFTMDGDALVVHTSAPAPAGKAPKVTTVTYKRYERGHGG